MACSDYAGESRAKKCARAFTYLGARAEMKGSVRGRALVLCGDGGDVAPMRDFMEWPADKVVAVDISADAIAAWPWPEVVPIHGDLTEVIAGLPDASLEFVVLDLCCNAVSAIRFVRLLRNKVQRGGIVAITYFKGREGEEDFSTWEVALANCGVDAAGLPPTHQRRAGAAALFAKVMDSERWPWLCDAPVGSIEYCGTSPMEMLILKRVDVRTFLPRNPAIAWASDDEDDLRNGALLVADKIGVKKAAAVYNLRPATLVAWKAQRTRGAYDEADKRWARKVAQGDRNRVRRQQRAAHGHLPRVRRATR